MALIVTWSVSRCFYCWLLLICHRRRCDLFIHKNISFLFLLLIQQLDHGAILLLLQFDNDVRSRIWTGSKLMQVCWFVIVVAVVINWYVCCIFVFFSLTMALAQDLQVRRAADILHLMDRGKIADIERFPPLFVNCAIFSRPRPSEKISVPTISRRPTDFLPQFVANSSNGHLSSLARKSPLSSPFWLLSNPALFSSSAPNCSWESRSCRIFQVLEIWYSGDLLLRRFGRLHGVLHSIRETFLFFYHGFWALWFTQCFTRRIDPNHPTSFLHANLYQVSKVISNRTTLRDFYVPICTKFPK